MPRIKRWFPVNHNINRDPEIWVMRRQIGEKSLSIWLEFLSISDQNEGEIPGAYEELIRSVSGTCQATVRTVTAVYQYAISQVWLKCEPTLHVVKYWNYHKSREPQKTLLGSLPSEPSDPILPKYPKKDTYTTAVIDLNFEAFYKAYPKKRNKPAALRAWKKEAVPIAPEIIMAALEKHKLSHDWQKEQGRFIPNPASWLNGRCWDDELLGEEFRETMEQAAARQERLMEKAYGKRTNH